MPWRRLRMISSRCCCSGRPLTSTTLSSMRVNTRTTSLYSSQSKRGLVGEGVAHELGQVDRAQQAGAVRRQRLLAAGVGRADVLAPPVVVHLVDAVDQDEARLGVVVRRDHDHVPQVPRADVAVDLAGDQAVVADDVVLVRAASRARRPASASSRSTSPCSLMLTGNTSGQSRVGLDRVHEAVGDQQRQVELAQAAVFALGADEVLHVRVRRRRTCPSARRGGHRPRTR